MIELSDAILSPGHITFHVSGREEAMLRIAPDGFYVRGVKLEQDEHEAKKVYDALKEWLRRQS